MNDYRIQLHDGYGRTAKTCHTVVGTTASWENGIFTVFQYGDPVAFFSGVSYVTVHEQEAKQDNTRDTQA